jgi:hypothetical protein
MSNLNKLGANAASGSHVLLSIALFIRCAAFPQDQTRSLISPIERLFVAKLGLGCEGVLRNDDLDGPAFGIARLNFHHRQNAARDRRPRQGQRLIFVAILSAATAVRLSVISRFERLHVLPVDAFANIAVSRKYQRTINQEFPCELGAVGDVRVLNRSFIDSMHPVPPPSATKGTKRPCKLSVQQPSLRSFYILRIVD